MQTNSTKFPDLQKFIGKIFNTQENNFPQVVDISEISWWRINWTAYKKSDQNNEIFQNFISYNLTKCGSTANV